MTLAELHRCAVFCLLQCGAEVRATDLVTVDRTLTDICFEEPQLLYDLPSLVCTHPPPKPTPPTGLFHKHTRPLCSNKAGPGFQLRLEIYSTRLLEDLDLCPAGPLRARRLQGSLGCSSRKKIRAAFESATMFRSKSGGMVGVPATAAAAGTV